MGADIIQCINCFSVYLCCCSYLFGGFVGIGGDFEQVAENAKRALMLPLGTPNPDPFYAQLEEELLEAINQTGIGVQGLGGRTTCLGLHIIAAPTHIAGLPVAVNVSCHVTRHATAVL